MFSRTAISFVVTMLVAARWKIPIGRAAFGSAALAVAVSLPFGFIYARSRTSKARIVLLLAQLGFTLGFALGLVLRASRRDPERVSPTDKGLVVSPADGHVIYLNKVAEATSPLVSKKGRAYRLDELTGTYLATAGAHVIGIEMNMLDVHTNRCPVGGRVKLVKHIGGNFISLRDPEAPFVNERCTTVIEKDGLVVATVQVASRLVRRIDNSLQCGDQVELGQRFGAIRFGSLVALVIPSKPDVRIECKVGNRMTAGVSVVARYDTGSTREQPR